MLQAKFCGYRPVSSGEEDFERFLPYMGVAAIFGHVTQMPQTNFRAPYPKRLHIKFGFDWPSVF